MPIGKQSPNESQHFMYRKKLAVGTKYTDLEKQYICKKKYIFKDMLLKRKVKGVTLQIF